jgi:hypothetical protein
VALRHDDLHEAPRDHVVEFYDDDDGLADNVAAYLSEAILAGGVAIAIATGSHLEAFHARLVQAGIDPDAARERGTLVFFDAGEAMDCLLVDGHPAPHRFDKLIGELIREAAAGDRPVRAYGEIVALMWADGYVTAALELESMWNGLCREVDFSLYCAYPNDLVGDERHAASFHEVCRQHSAVVRARPERPPLSDATRDLVRAFRWSGTSPADARRFVTEGLRAWGLGDLADDAAIVATELATNAVVHARSDFTVTISRRPSGRVRIAVADESTLPPLPRRPAPFDGSGRGLGMIEAIAVIWGVDLVPAGKVVWAEVRR